jgi:hypothetical protein
MNDVLVTKKWYASQHSMTYSKVALTNTSTLQKVTCGALNENIKALPGDDEERF